MLIISFILGSVVVLTRGTNNWLVDFILTIAIFFVIIMKVTRK